MEMDCWLVGNEATQMGFGKSLANSMGKWEERNKQKVKRRMKESNKE
jgi:hypothetical protein